MSNVGGNARSPSAYHERLQRIREKFPNAYERWSKDEEEQLGHLISLGMSITQIAHRLGRQPSAIRSRIRRIDEKGLLDEPDVGEEGSYLAWQLEPRESAFLPLAISWMAKNAVCVAGLDLHSHEWIRLVRERKYSLGTEDGTQFSYGQAYAVELDGYQKRPSMLDPRELHVEDRVFRNSPRLLGGLLVKQQLEILNTCCDEDLLGALGESRSLFLVEPEWFKSSQRKDGKEVAAFGTKRTSTLQLRKSETLRKHDIRVSSGGCPSNCLPWLSRQSTARHRISSLGDITSIAPTARVFFALSLTGWARDLPLDKQGHYLILAGVHIIDEENKWL